MLHVLLPVRCVVCAWPGEGEVCARCLDGLPRLRPPLCGRCGAPTAWPVGRCRECAGRRLAFSTARAAVAYDARVKTLVAAWKEHGLRGLAALAADLVTGTVAAPDACALAFVPGDGDRSLWRGHQPAERLARELGRRWDLPVERLIVRARRTPRQRGLPLSARRKNVAHAFAPARAAPAAVVLVDDVYTTGATASAAASALRRAGARRVHVVTFARAIR